MATYEHINQKVEKMWQQSEDFSVRVPQVMQRRIYMMARQNPLNNAKEMKEMERMVTEKPIAFFESWTQMAWQALVAQQNIGQLMFSNCMKLSLGQPISLQNFFYAVNQEALHVLEKGMHPIYSRVAANAKRLS